MVAVWTQGLSRYKQPGFGSAEFRSYRRSGAAFSQPDAKRAIGNSNRRRGIRALLFKEQLGCRPQHHAFHRNGTGQPHRLQVAVQQRHLHTELLWEWYCEYKFDQSVPERNEHHG